MANPYRDEQQCKRDEALDLSRDISTMTFSDELQPVPATTAGWLYVLTNPAMPGLVKIGYSQEADPKIRFRQLSAATGVPERFVAHGFEYSTDCLAAEVAVHLKLERRRPNPKREFFRMDAAEALEAIREIIRSQNDPNSLGAESLSCALVRGIALGEEAIALKLIEGGADVNTVFDDVHSCYDAALVRGLAQVARAMEEREVTQTSFALLWALDNKDQDAINYCLRPGVLEQIDLRFGQRLLSKLLLLGLSRITELRFLLARGVNVNFYDEEFGSPLSVGIYNLEVASALLEAGADPNMVIKRRDFPLIIVLERDLLGRQSPEMIRLLLEAGANPNVFSLYSSKTPLMLACERGDFESAGLLLDAGADAALQDKEGVDALGYLVCHLYFLLRYKDREGSIKPSESLRRRRAISAQAGIVSAEAFALRLIEHGADVNSAAPEVGSLIYWAVTQEKVELFQTCLVNGGNVFIRDCYGNTVLHHATGYENVEMVAMLLSHPSLSARDKRTLLCSRNNDGDTPLHCMSAEAIELANILLNHAVAPALLLRIPDARGAPPAVSEKVGG